MNDEALSSKLSRMSPRQILVLYTQALDELRRRSLVRSKNNPVADIAELLVVEALGLKLSGKSTKGYDAVDRQGNRYQIKGRRPTADNKSRQLSFIRGLDEAERPFDFLVGVIFAEDFSVLRGCIIPVQAIAKLAQHRKRENAWRLVLRDTLWELDGVRDITAVLKKVESTLLGCS